MLPRLLSSLLLLLGFSGSALARTLFVEVEVLHAPGLRGNGDLNGLLTSPELRVEAHYQPTKLIDGATARREKIMPIGSKLFAIGQITSLTDGQIMRQGQGLQFRVDEAHPAHASYRLESLRLVLPIAAGPGRPQSEMDITLSNALERQGAHETAVLSRTPAFEIGLRLRYRWADAPGSYVLAPLPCDGEVQALGKGQYRFRPEQRLLRLLRLMGAIDFGSVGQQIPPGARRFMLASPYPAVLADWQVGDQQLVQVPAAGRVLEALTLHIERKGLDGCRYMRTYEAWLADGKPVKVKRSGYGLYTDVCEEPKADEGTTEMRWNDDGSLAYFMESTRLGTRLWDEFHAGNPACAADQSPPPGAHEVDTLRDEFIHLRAAFLKGGQP
jgi:hypothetical protein